MSVPLKVIVEDTENIIYEGEAERITSFNEVGKFDVYPQHANFISIIHTQLDVYNQKQKVKELKIEQAVMKVKKDEVHVFLGIETLLIEEIGPGQKSSPPQQKK